jgi:hypothetical protein
MSGSHRCVVVGLVFGVAVGVVAAANDAEVMSRLEGRWVYGGGEPERQARQNAIEETVSQMSWIARGMARKRITASTVIHEHYVITLNGGTVTIAEDDFKGHSAPWNGTEVEIAKDQGGPATLTRSVDDGGLRSHWHQKRGAGTEIYCVSKDGESMVVTVIVSSPRLPSEVSYELTYRRVE